MSTHADLLIAAVPIAIAAPNSAPNSAPSTAAWNHPHASHCIDLQGTGLQRQTVAYALKRGPRRSIGFMVDPQGLSVVAPVWLGVSEIEAALHEKSRWILKKLTEQQLHLQRLQATKVVWREGATLDFLGESLRLVCSERADHLTQACVHNPRAGTLCIGPHAAADPALVARQLQHWLQARALEVFHVRAQYFAPRLGVEYQKLCLSAARTRWGSASCEGVIRLNWRLVHFSLPVIDYVVVHELAHLLEMNHSPRFWAIVRSVFPHVEQAKYVLKTTLVPSFD
jgi:predicted metal-dependent hydrolase